MDDIRDAAKKAAVSLLHYCKRENWAGYDPYDGLNSRIFGALPLYKSRLFRLIVIQGMKRSPINLRPLLLVPKGENPKACALFCSSLIRLSNSGILPDDSLISERIERLIELRSKDTPYYCWGYHFDWQGRGFFLPKFVPNIICTTFGGNALLDAYEKYGENNFLDAASSAGKFLINGLNISNVDGGICFSYTPLDDGQVHNANLLGAAFLGKLSELTGDKEFRDKAEKAVRFTLSRQNADGSWSYGEGSKQGWIDNFHTGFNLVALWRLTGLLNDNAIDDAVFKGLDFYVNHFFTDEGIPKYYHDKVWPIDIHSVAQSIVTLCELRTLYEGALPLAAKVCQWALDNMQSKEGYFYYQKTRYYDNRISYMRWSQAWMLFALSVFLTTGTEKIS